MSQTERAAPPLPREIEMVIVPRAHDVAMDLDGLATQAGHAELVYDFRDGGDADGWLHGLFRYEHRHSGHAAETSFGAWHQHSATSLLLHNSAGEVIFEHAFTIACSGSAMIYPDEIFGAERLAQAGQGGYVLIRDTTCRLFGYHGLTDDKGGFSLDHMFGF